MPGMISPAADIGKALLHGALLAALFISSSSSGSFAVDEKDALEALSRNDELNYVFDISSFPSVTLEFTAREWNKQLVFFDANPRHEEYVEADFIFEKNGKAERVKNVGARIRGGAFSRRRVEGSAGKFHDPVNPVWRKAHFSVNFKKYKKKKRFHGLRGMNLRFIKDDPTYVRELYGYDLARRFGIWSMHSASFARVYIKIEGEARPAYFGIYIISEKPGEDFLERRFEEDGGKGNLWKCLWTTMGHSANLSPETVTPQAVGEENISLNEADSFRPIYDLKSGDAGLEEAADQLNRFIRDLNSKKGKEFVNWVESSMDVDQFLKLLAVNVVLGRWDNYWVTANNYYLYFDKTGKAYFIPYDFDNTLGTSIFLRNAGTQDVMKYGPMNASRPLVSKILAVPKFRERYKTHILALLKPSNGYFDYGASVKRIGKWRDMLKDHVRDDTGEMTGMADLPASWSNTPFYRLFSGGDSGAAPEANWFKTRARYAMEQVKSDKGWKPPAPPKNTALFLKGPFNRWSSSGAYRFGRENGKYHLDLYLDGTGGYKFRIADEDMKPMTNFGASAQDNIARLGVPLRLYSQYTDPTLKNVEFYIKQAGTYRFELDLSDMENQALTVTPVSTGE